MGCGAGTIAILLMLNDSLAVTIHHSSHAADDGETNPENYEEKQQDLTRELQKGVGAMGSKSYMLLGHERSTACPHYPRCIRIAEDTTYHVQTPSITFTHHLSRSGLPIITAAGTDRDIYGEASYYPLGVTD